MKNNIKIPLIIFLSLVGLILFIALLGVAYLYSARQQEISDLDRNLIISPAHLEPYFSEYKSVNSAIKVKKVKYIDGELELRMDYDIDDDEQPYMSVVITKSRKKSDASSTYFIAWTAQNAIYNAYDSKFEIVEDNEFFSLGDKSRFAFVNYNGQILGNRFVFMQDKTVFEFTLTGFYIDDPGIWQALFAGKLEQLASFK